MKKHRNKSIRLNMVILLSVLMFTGTGIISAATAKNENKGKDEEKTEKKAEPDMKEIVKRLKVNPIVQAPTSRSSTYYDNRSQTIKCRLNIANEAREDVDGLSGEIYIIGKSVSTSKEFKLFKIVTLSDISVPKGKKYASEEKTCRIEYDSNNFFKYGHKYEGYLLVLKDSSGEIIMKKGIPGKFERIADKIAEIEEGNLFDDKGTPLESSNRY